MQQFDVQLKNVTPQGRFGVVFTSNSFDTSGGPLPAMTESSVRIAKGIRIKPRFLRSERLCQTGKLRLILLDNQPRGVTYEQMLGDLTKIRNRIARKLKPKSLAIVDACRRSYVGKGTFIVDARPSFPEVLPGTLYVFLSSSIAKGAIGGFGVMTIPRLARHHPLYRAAALRAAGLHGQPLRRPDARALYGYRLQLLPDNFGRLPFSVAELRVESRGHRRDDADPRRQDDQRLLGVTAQVPRVRQPPVPGGLPLPDGPADEHHRPGAVPALHTLSG